MHSKYRRLLPRVAAAAVVVLFGAMLAPPALAADPTLQSWGSAKVLTDDIRVNADPTVVVTPGGRSVAIWIERHGLSDRLMVSRLSAGSAHWSAPQQLSGRAFNAAIATHGHNSVTVAWQQHESHGASIQSRTMSANGTWGPTEQISQWSQSGGVLVSLVLAGNVQGDLVAVWTRGNYIRTSYRSLPGDWQPEEALPVRGAYALTAVANVDNSGAVDLIFTKSLNNAKSDLYAYHRALNGTWSGVTLARIVNESHSRAPTFAAAGSRRGDVSVAWVARSPGEDPGVFFSYQRKAEPFSPAELVSAHSLSPALDVDESGTTTVAWATIESGPSLIDLARRSLSGDWGPTQILAQGDKVSRVGPELVVDGNSNGDDVVHVVGWADNAGAQNPKHLMFRCPSGNDCGAGFELTPPSYSRSLTFATTPTGGATALWTSGCATEECIPTRVQARTMTPA